MQQTHTHNPQNPPSPIVFFPKVYKQKNKNAFILPLVCCNEWMCLDKGAFSSFSLPCATSCPQSEAEQSSICYIVTKLQSLPSSKVTASLINIVDRFWLFTNLICCVLTLELVRRIEGAGDFSRIFSVASCQVYMPAGL